MHVKKFEDFTFNEKIVNLFGNDIFNYINELYTLVINAYKPLGGLKGKGFENIENLLKSIKMVKMFTRQGRITAAIFYKDKKKDGRKAVAFCTNATIIGRNDLKMLLKDEFQRSYIEISSSLLRFIEKNFPYEFEKFRIRNDEDLDIFKDVIPIDEFFYKRKIGNELITKIAIGTPRKEFY